MTHTVIDTINSSGIVGIIRGITKREAQRVTEALIMGGIKCIEVTYNTPEAHLIISELKSEYGKDILIGAGTITSVDEAKKVYESGAEFILSPSLHKDVIDFCKKNNIVSIPGAYTPTEIVMADKWGADIIKIFPAGALGCDYIKMVRGPINNVNMMAVGGINIDNVESLIKSGYKSVGVGGSLVNKEYIKKGEYGRLTELAKSYIMKINEARAYQ